MTATPPSPASSAASFDIAQATRFLRREILGDRARVLVVEDDPDCMVCFKHVFAMTALRRFRAQFVPSVNEALAIIVMGEVDIAVIDYQLADGTAADLVRLWRSYGYELPFIVISGYDDPAHDREMQELGALGWIAKGSGVTAEELERRIRYGLGNYWATRCAECPVLK